MEIPDCASAIGRAIFYAKCTKPPPHWVGDFLLARQTAQLDRLALSDHLFKEH